MTGIDGANPLGFLAAVGTAITTRHFSADVRLSWQGTGGAWRPVLSCCERDEERFIELLHDALAATSSSPFTIDKKLPFDLTTLTSALHKAQNTASSHDRRLADFLTAFGSEAAPDKETFKDSAFRMVRSGDAAGQGLPVYAQSIREHTDKRALFRTLFEPWNYTDQGFSLRWDPLEDQRYALRWHDPSGDKDKHAPKTMLGANALAIEALVLFPTTPRPNGLATTGFFQSGRREFFTWPIWTHPVSPEMLRSLASLPELHCERPPRKTLAARGVAEIYRCERIPNGYYKNFSPSIPA